jgi:hypothetical protein
MTTRQYARLLADWVASIGLDPRVFGTHSLRDAKPISAWRNFFQLRHPLATEGGLVGGEAGNVSAGPGEALDVVYPDKVTHHGQNGRNGTPYLPGADSNSQHEELTRALGKPAGKSFSERWVG